jgi:hypothetical protein
MAGPLAGISAAQIASQKLPEQGAQQANKAGASKFDQALKAKGPDQAGQVQPNSQVGQVQHAQKAEQLRKVDQVGQTEKAQLNKTQTAGNDHQQGTRHSDPVSQKQEVSKAKDAVSGLFANIERGQATMDKLVNGALGGKNFSNQELLQLQAGMYKYSQELDLTSKVVEKATSGLKDTLKTQV